MERVMRPGEKGCVFRSGHLEGEGGDCVVCSDALPSYELSPSRLAAREQKASVYGSVSETNSAEEGERTFGEGCPVARVEGDCKGDVAGFSSTKVRAAIIALSVE